MQICNLIFSAIHVVVAIVVVRIFYFSRDFLFFFLLFTAPHNLSSFNSVCFAVVVVVVG